MRLSLLAFSLGMALVPLTPGMGLSLMGYGLFSTQQEGLCGRV
jgi:hypothetical protein